MNPAETKKAFVIKCGDWYHTENENAPTKSQALAKRYTTETEVRVAIDALCRYWYMNALYVPVDA